ncbi:MAG: MarR family transcriptional regulator [Actinomycetales bacterium]|nr:MAG: MarR family transcriptional regulator [Actinomycetales bacterium]
MASTSPTSDVVARELTLSDLLCFDLYATSRQVIGVYRPLLDEAGLTYPQFLVLLALWETDEQSMKELAAGVRLDYGTISPLVKRLDARGLVTRHRNPADERSTIVTLTPDGDALRTLGPRMTELMVASMGIDLDDLVTLRGLLSKIRDGLAASGA